MTSGFGLGLVIEPGSLPQIRVVKWSALPRDYQPQERSFDVTVEAGKVYYLVDDHDDPLGPPVLVEHRTSGTQFPSRVVLPVSH